MGEDSKLIGEYGEKSVENFLNLIGWLEPLKAIGFGCNSNEHLNRKGNQKKTHGLDFFYHYISPLVDSVLHKIHISSKYSDKAYPNSPNTKFIEHCEDLFTAMDCFEKSERSKEIMRSIRNYSQIENIGVLFWLSSNPDTYFDLIPKVASSLIRFDSNYDKLFVVDNKRIDFIYRAITFCQASFPSKDLSFYYPDTGKNINPLTKKNYGKVLPVEYINTSILPIRIEDTQSGVTNLILLSIDPFEKEDLKRLIDLSQRLSNSWTGKVVIAFKTYNEVRNGADVRLVKSLFESRKTKEDLIITSYDNSFIKLQE